MSRKGYWWHVDCHVQGSVSMRSVTIAVVREGVDSTRRLLEIVVPLLSCVDDWRSVAGISVESDMGVGCGLAALFVPAKPMVLRRFDVSWLTSLIRRHLVQEFSGLEPLSALEYLRFRLSSVVSDSFFDSYLLCEGLVMFFSVLLFVFVVV